MTTLSLTYEQRQQSQAHARKRKPKPPTSLINVFVRFLDDLAIYISERLS